jgi:hypothetical protein
VETPHLEEDLKMSLTPDELIVLAPDAIGLVQEISAALKKDADGKVVVTREEARRIRAAVLELAAKIAKEAID